MRQVCGLLAFLGVVGALKATDVSNQASTPVHKVAALLLKVRDQVQEDGAKEAASYDKFACFCKAEADNKVFYIDKSNTLIGELQASITALTGEISQLDGDVVTLKADLATEEADATTSETEATAEYTAYSTTRANLTDGVKVITKAIERLRQSREGVANVKAAALLAETFKALEGLGLSSQPAGAAPTYSYRSGDVISVLQSLLATFKAELATTDEEFGVTKHDRNMVDGARFNKITVMKDDIALKQKISAAKTEEQVTKQGALDEETTGMTADQAFLVDLTSSCSAKSSAWDERSQIRAAEITALTQASNTLSESAGLYNVNKKLVDFQKHTSVTADVKKGTQKQVKAHAAPKAKGVALLQLRGGGGGLGAIVRFLNGRADLLHSSAIAQLVQVLSATSPDPDAAAAPVDHFASVRGIVKDLITKLEAEAANEATQKSLCDTQMQSAVEKRDARTADMETAGAGMDQTDSEIKTLTNDISTASQEIADMYKQQTEMEELRSEEKANNEKSIADAQAGAQAIEQANEILQEFYEQYGLVQKQKYDPVGGDRDGRTVADMAPETFNSDESYKGKQAESKGIFGLLAIIKSDFERTQDLNEGNEKDAATAYAHDKKLLAQQIDLKEKGKTASEGEKETKEGDLITLKDDKKTATDLHATALTELEKLSYSCVDTGESWAERKANRLKEIEALKQALQILEDWKN